MLDLFDELRQLVSLLNHHDVEYALCGGLAMSIHARPRSTIDIDLMVLPESLDQVISIAGSLGYNIRGKDLSFANGVIEIRRVSKIDRTDGELLSLDLLLVTSEIRVVWDNRVQADWEGGTLSVVSRKGLIALKELRRSGQDLDDIKALSEGGSDDES